MRHLLLLLALLGAGLLGSAGRLAAQQVICQRGLGAYSATTPYSLLAGVEQLTAISPDSCLLYVHQPPGTTFGVAQTRTRLVWLTSAGCDTARFASLPTSQEVGAAAYLVRRRQGDVLLASTQSAQTATDSNHTFLRSYSRRGVLRWARTYTPGTAGERMLSVLEAPDQGAYFTALSARVNESLNKVDGQGNLQWQRQYYKSTRQGFYFGRPAYTVRGNLLLGGSYSDLNGTGALVMEVNQRGDSLTSRLMLTPSPSQYLVMTGMRALRDGGFLLTTYVDSLINGGRYDLPHLIRLDANLNVRWRCTQRTPPLRYTGDLSQGGYELADGTLLVAFVNRGTGVLRFLHIAAAGTLLATYLYQPAYPSANQTLTPLAADSSFVLVGNRPNNNGLAIDHFRIPGLRRVLPEPPLPAPQVLAAHLALAPAFPAPAYPNPARDLVTVPLPAGSSPGRLVLLDLAGRQVRAQAVAGGATAATLPLAGLAPGLYLLQFEREGQPPATQRLAVGW